MVEAHHQDPTRGAPLAGLISAYQFGPDGTAIPIATDQVDAALADTSGWVWLHLALTDTRAREWIASHAPLTDRGRMSLTGPDDHLHLDVVGREIIGTIPDLRRELGKGSEELGRLRFVMTERVLISGRRKPSQAIEETRRAIEGGQRFVEAIGLIDAIMHKFADAVSELAQGFGEQLDQVEDRLTRDEPSDERQRLGRIRMQTVRIQRQLSHIRSLFHRIEPRLAGEQPRVAAAVRTLALKLDSVDHELAAVYDRSHLLHDELGAKTADLTNRRCSPFRSYRPACCRRHWSAEDILA